jgi:hypothetical protein
MLALFIYSTPLYDSDSFYFKGRNFRRDELEDYNFVCECLACENDFPDLMSGLLNVGNLQTLKMTQKIYNELQDPRRKLSIDEAKKLSRKYSMMLNEYYDENDYPNREMVLMQLCIVKCFLTAAKTNIVMK